MIQTPNLQLIPCELSHFAAIVKEDDAALASLLQVSLAEDWLGFPAAKEAMRPSFEYLKAHPSAFGWWTYLFLHTADCVLIGLGGFKGVPKEGVAEIGYAIAPAYRGRGLATEAARGMIDYAFSHPEVRRVDAHTLPEKNPSTRVLERVGMRYVGVVSDPEDGEIWHWCLERGS
jgi:RimJ/RimL family protein N-acetyltransferase